MIATLALGIVLVQAGVAASDEASTNMLVIKWGEPAAAVDNDMTGAWPEWALGAYKDGGLWLTNLPAWYVSASAETNSGSLNIEFDREKLPGDMTFEVVFSDFTNSSLYIHLYDTNGVVVATNLSGNLIEGGGAVVRATLDIPFARFPEAWAIRLQRGFGPVAVYESVIYATRTGANEEDRTGPSSAAAEKGRQRVAKTTTTRAGRGVSGNSFKDYFVSKQGSDAFDGSSPMWQGGMMGPKRTIVQAINEAPDLAEIEVQSGTYIEKQDVWSGGGRRLYFKSIGRVVIKGD